MIVKGIISAIDLASNTVDVILPEYDNIVVTPVNKHDSQTTSKLKVNDFVLVFVFNNDFNDTLLVIPSAANGKLDVSGGTINGDLNVLGAVTIGGKALLDWMYPPGFYCICDSSSSPSDLLGGTWELAETSGEKHYWKRVKIDNTSYTMFVDEIGNLYVEGEGNIPTFEYDESTGNLYTDSTQTFEYDKETGNLYLID